MSQVIYTHLSPFKSYWSVEPNFGTFFCVLSLCGTTVIVTELPILSFSIDHIWRILETRTTLYVNSFLVVQSSDYWHSITPKLMSRYVTMTPIMTSRPPPNCHHRIHPVELYNRYIVPHPYLLWFKSYNWRCTEFSNFPSWTTYLVQ